MGEKISGLIVTVGFSEEPILFSIRTFMPRYVECICTSDSIDLVVKVSEALAHDPATAAISLSRHIVDKTRSSDTILAVRAAAERLLAYGVPREEIAIDSTGGTKPMTAGAILAAAHLGLRNVYVNVDTGPDRRPIPSSMRIMDLPSPYDSIGFVEARLGAVQFRRHEYTTAVHIFSSLAERVIDLRLRTLYRGIAILAKSLDMWDKFMHQDARETMVQARSILQSYYMDTGHAAIQTVIALIDEKLSTLEALSKKKGTILPILDLLNNAQRRFVQERYDDSVARSYRTIEAVEQYALAKYGIDTSAPDYSKLDESVKNRLMQDIEQTTLPREISCVHGYILLNILGSPIGIEFSKKRSQFLGLLKARNESILAHGYEPATASSSKGLLNLAEHLVKELCNIESIDFARENMRVQHPILPEGLLQIF